MEYKLTKHAEQELIHRNIPLKLVEEVIRKPEQIVEEKFGRTAYQSRLNFEGVTYLFRLIIDITTTPITVITVYRTKKIEKYWRGSI